MRGKLNAMLTKRRIMKKLIVLIISAVLFSTLAVVASAENIEYFYVNSETGNDRATAYDAVAVDVS